jgi:hypothetical protein
MWEFNPNFLAQMLQPKFWRFCEQVLNVTEDCFSGKISYCWSCTQRLLL